MVGRLSGRDSKSSFAGIDFINLVCLYLPSITIFPDGLISCLESFLTDGTRIASYE